jgi:dephospho-CoA kinase
MIRLAIVGDIGSGKSHIAKLFGFPIFNADSEVSKLYKKNKKCYAKLKKALPNHIISFPIKKSQLSKAITSNKNALKKIIKIVHPEIKKIMHRFVKKNKNKKVVILDIPLLMENKINRKSDIIIFVDAKKKEINKRLKKRDNFSPKIVKKLKKLQLPLELKRKRSNFIIKNNFKNNYVKKNVKKILRKILSNA